MINIFHLFINNNFYIIYYNFYFCTIIRTLSLAVDKNEIHYRSRRILLILHLELNENCRLVSCDDQ